MALPSTVFGQRLPITQQASTVTAFDLIVAMNTLRMSYGLPALVEDPIVDAVAQATANTMAANQMTWHIGDVSGRLSGSGYGGGSKVWGTENFAMGDLGIDEIMIIWSDASHMIPAVNPAYCNVGAGTAKAANGMTYYVLQAAYTDSKSCGDYQSPNGPTNPENGSTNDGRVGGASQAIVPVKIASPDSTGKIFHKVEPGQSFWAIAIAYKITIKDLETWNNLSKNSKLQVGQLLFIPSSNTAGYSTPTQPGMVLVSKPDESGRIIHVVQSYQTLTTIAQAYAIKIETLLKLNQIQADWPLQIGQKLIIQASSSTPSPTPTPLSPVQRLTPAEDGKYYHVVQVGETLFWISAQYNLALPDLLSWNYLDANSIIVPNQKILLLVTPELPATPTNKPSPPTATPTIQPATATPLAAPTVSPVPPSPTPTPNSNESNGLALPAVAIAAIGTGLAILFFRKKITRL